MLLLPIVRLLLKKKGHKHIMIRTVDTDVLVVASYFLLTVEELWIAFGTGNKFRYLAIDQYALSDRARALLCFMPLLAAILSFFAALYNSACVCVVRHTEHAH